MTSLQLAIPGQTHEPLDFAIVQGKTLGQHRYSLRLTSVAR